MSLAVTPPPGLWILNTTALNRSIPVQSRPTSRETTKPGLSPIDQRTISIFIDHQTVNVHDRNSAGSVHGGRVALADRKGASCRGSPSGSETSSGSVWIRTGAVEISIGPQSLFQVHTLTGLRQPTRVPAYESEACKDPRSNVAWKNVGLSSGGKERGTKS